MFKFDQLLDKFVKRDLEVGLVPMLLGEPGIGKSSWAQALATSMATKCFTLACNQLADKADLTGARLVPDGEDKNGVTRYKQVFYPHAVIADAIKYASENPRQRPILFLDEINRTTADVTSAALSLPTLRAIGSMKLPDNLTIIIAGNDKGNITSLDEASISRFVLYRTIPDVATFFTVNPNLNPFVAAVLKRNPETIFCKTVDLIAVGQKGKDDDDDDIMATLDEIIDEGDEMRQLTTSRTITAVSDWLNLFSQQEMIEALSITYVEDGTETNALQEGIEGHVGKTRFAALLMGEIVNGISSMQTNVASGQNIGKPQCYDDLKAKGLTTVQELNEFVETMSTNDKSSCLLYALYEKEDNKVIIAALAAETPKLESNDMKTLMLLASNEQIDIENKNAFLNTGTPIAAMLGVVLETA